MRIVFMGTPDYAVPSLQKLIDEHYEIAGVFTQPDKKVGRKQILTPSAVKELAERYELPVYQPQTLKDGSAYEILKSIAPDMIIVAAYGKILPKSILDLPKYGCVNVHASLLPKYRGASPIQHVIIDGEKETGVTIMQMDAGLDTGDMLYKKTVEIAADDTFETLHDKLMALGGEAIVEALPLLEKGALIPEKQNSGESCYASLISKSMGEIDFSKDAVTIDRLIRGMNPWPSAYTYYRGRQLKIWKAVPVNGQEAEGSAGEAQPGTIVKVAKDAFFVACGDGCLQVLELQLEGKKRMSTHDFLLGVKPGAGERLGKSEG